MSLEKPTIVVVPGSFSPAFLYDDIISQLSPHGYSATAISLPSVGRRPDAAPATLADDAAHINSIATKLADEGKDIILALHSYGGIPGTESACGLAKADRHAKGLKGGIIRLVYFASFLVEEGQSLRDVTGATPESVPMDNGYMIIDERLKALYAPFVYPDLPAEQGLDYAAFKYLPVTYLICENDQVIAPELQRKMVEMAKNNSTMEVDIISCTAGHGVNISMPEAVVKAIERAAGNGI